MSNTLRKDRDGNIFKESLKKKSFTSRYRCRCERCVGKKDLTDKIVQKELKQQIEIDEYNFKPNGEFIEDIDDPYYTVRINNDNR